MFNYQNAGHKQHVLRPTRLEPNEKENVMNKRINPFIRAALRRLALAGTMFCASHAFAAAPFNYAAYENGDKGGPLVEDQSASATAMVSGANGQKARASYGDNGVALPSSGGYALSVWSDGFVVNGGSGVGTLKFSVQLHGTLFDPQEDVVYALLKSEDPNTFFPSAIVADSGTGYTNISGASPVLLIEVDATPDYVPGPNVYSFSPGFINELINVSLPFTYGQTFYLASILDIFGYGDFYNSATFGITAPEGASINNLSGTLYPVATVPLPETWAIMLAGLGLLGVQHRRKA
jgi:hypothetical protein